MFSLMQLPDTNIVELKFDGQVTAAEFDDGLAQLEELIRTNGHIRLMEVIGRLDFPPIPFSRFWEDLKFGFDHLAHITHCAVVADQPWIAMYCRLLNPILKAEVKHFPRRETVEALDWLKHVSS